MVMVVNRIQGMGPEVYSFDAARQEARSPHAVKHEHRNSYPMHENHASTPLRSSHSLGSILQQHLPDHDYALVARNPEGQYETVVSNNWQETVDQIYSEQFRRQLGYSRKPDYRLRTMSMGPRGSFGSDYDEYQDDGSLQGSRKRARTRSQAVNKGAAQTSIVISDRVAIRNHYESCFKGVQQQCCKIFGKAWVKMMEPKKQSNHPYVKGNTTGPAPPWWPSTEGDKDQKVRHKEPDHLGKQERIVLFCHILEIIVDPQHPARPRREPSHAQEVSIAELESVTESSLADFYAVSKKNAMKAVYLQDLFEVAKIEERYRRGELPHDYVVRTSQGARASEVDPDDDDDRELYSSHSMGASGLATPDTMVSAHETGQFRGQEFQNAESYGNYTTGMREPVYPRYGGQLPPTPEENNHYTISSSENYPPQSTPVSYQPITAYTMHEPRRPSWQPTEYNPGHQLPPVNTSWSTHGQGHMVSPIQVSQYGGWSAPGPQPQATLLPPMQPSMHEQHSYQDAGFMKVESHNSQQN